MNAPRHLPADEVHVWRAWLDLSDGAVVASGATLGEEEVARAGRFRQPVDRRRFVARRGLLRRVLAGYLACAPAEVAISRCCEHCGDRRHGRPRLAVEARIDLRFSATATGSLAVVAVVGGRHVGVDVTGPQPGFAVEAISRQAMASGEASALRALPLELQGSAALFAWAAKEAYLKGIGRGFAVDPRSVPVTADPRAAPSFAPGSPAETWSLRRLVLPDGYVGAVALGAGGTAVALGAGGTAVALGAGGTAVPKLVAIDRAA